MTVQPFFDFEAGEFVTGRNGTVEMVCGVMDLKNRIQKILHTPKDRFLIYRDSGYGNRLEELLIGKTLPREYIVSEVERQVKDAVLKNPDVSAVDSFDIVQDGARLSISFRVLSDYGSTEISEVIDVGQDI